MNKIEQILGLTVEEYQDRVFNKNARLRQMTKGDLNGSISGFSLTDYSILAHSMPKRIVASGFVSQGAFAFVVREPDAPFVEAASEGVKMLAADGNEFCERLPAGARFQVHGFNLTKLMELLPRGEWSANKALDLITHTKNQGELSKLLKLCSHSIERSSNKAMLINQLYLQLRELILNSEPSSAERQKLTSRQRTITKAVNYIQANIKTLFSTEQVAEHCSCSLRTLEYAFSSSINTTVKDFIIREKLHLVRRELSQTDDKSIKQVLQSYHIYSHGHFSKRYKEFYGQRLIDTKKNTR